ncbi:MAG: lipopolysaccharide transport periplasmic protein LptA [Burkholderiaceae bacterium]
MDKNAHSPLPPFAALALTLAAALCATLAASPAQAEKADKLKPLVITAESSGRADLVNQRTEFVGDVVLSKGTMLLRADKVDVRETSEGYYQAYASSEAGRQVSFRQASDTPGEQIEGSADQVEYDTRADTVRFIGKSIVRRKKGNLVSDELSGPLIVYDNRTEVLTVEGSQSATQPASRPRMVLMPRAASAPEQAPASAVPLRPSVELQPRKPS